MYPQNLEEFPPPPGVMGSLRAGFDAVASHVALILLPAVLDIFLWLGPRLSVNGLISPILTIIFNQARLSVTSATDLKQFAQTQTFISEMVARFNLLSLLGKLQVFPIGVSSLLVQKIPLKTPLGAQQVVEVSSGSLFIGLSFLLILSGWVL